MKPAASKFYEGDTCEEEQTTSSYDVNKWLENQPDGNVTTSLYPHFQFFSVFFQYFFSISSFEML